DCCCSVVKTPAEAATDPHFSARGVFDRKLDISGKSVPALPLPIAPEFRVSKDVAGRAASLGEDNLHYGAEPRDSE
ncbi:MAG: hypothetical protein ABJ201_18020, partial [Nisaea sp.]